MPWGKNTLVVAVATASSAEHVMMSDSRSTLGEKAVGLQVDFAPIDARFDGGAEGLLHPVHPADQGGEIGVAMGWVRVMSQA